MIINGTCERCGSDRSGYICRCGEMRCCCEKECLTCEQNQEYEDQQYEAEQAEREDFEDRMQDKYHH